MSQALNIFGWLAIALAVLLGFLGVGAMGDRASLLAETLFAAASQALVSGLILLVLGQILSELGRIRAALEPKPAQPAAASSPAEY